MADVTSGCTFSGREPYMNYREVFVQTANTADAGDTLTVTLQDYGIGVFLFAKGFKHTTDGSVMAREDPTTSVTSGVLTLTIPVGTDNDPRIYKIVGRPIGQ